MKSIAVTITLLLVLIAPTFAKGEAASVATPDDVCKFITSRMTTALADHPTLCSGKQTPSGSYLLDIFSPENVLEGKARRAWASTLFKTFEDIEAEKSLYGACQGTPVCFAHVSDSYMAAHNVRYLVLLDKDSLPSAIGASEFSDRWYIQWWKALFQFKQSDIETSKQNVMQLSEDACNNYIVALGNIQKELPTCSVMLATDDSVYISLDFESWADALLVGNEFELPKVFGKIFDNTGYDGQISFRSPWDDVSGSPFRVYYIFPLRTVELAYEEAASGIRDDLDAEELVRSNFIAGQMSKYTFLGKAQDNFVLRDTAILRFIATSGDLVLMDTTDGAEWKIPQDSLHHCKASIGDAVEESTLVISGSTAMTGAPSLAIKKMGTSCELKATFAQGW